MFNPNYKLTTKDIARLNMCSIRSAERLKRQIKIELGIKIVRYRHFVEFFDF